MSRDDEFFLTAAVLLIVMAMPFVLLYKIQITLKQKIGLAAVFGLATVIIITAIVRAIEITTKARIDLLLLSLWSIIESTIGRFRWRLS